MSEKSFLRNIAHHSGTKHQKIFFQEIKEGKEGRRKERRKKEKKKENRKQISISSLVFNA